MALDEKRLATAFAPPLAPSAAGRGRVAAALGAVVALAAALAPLTASAYILQLATDILEFAALAYSWNLISGFTGYLSFGQVAFFGIGAYTTSLLVLHTPIPWYVAVVISAAVSGLAAALLGTVMLRLRGIMFALGMLGLARILGVLATNWNFAGGAVGLTLPAQLTPIPVYLAMAAAALFAFGLNFFYVRSGWGLSAMGVRDDEGAARALGVPTTRVKVVSFVLSALMPATVGGLVAWNRSFLDPSSAFDPSLDLDVVVFVLFGGIGTLWGPLFGTIVLMLIGEELWAYVPELQLALYGMLVIAVVLAFPGGVVGIANRFGWLRRRAILAPPLLPAAERPPMPAAPVGEAAILEVRNLTVRFGGNVALDGISLSVRRGETLCIIGANGAGKTTLFNAITGFVVPSEGSVLYQGNPVAGIAPYRRAREGIARTFQIPRLMESMTVWENALLAARNGRRGHDAVTQAAWALHTVGLASMWLDASDRLTPGQRRRLELARALALDPTLILLDEVMAGMTRDEQEEVRNVLRRMREFGVAAVAGVEHVLAAIVDLSDRMIVLDQGHKIAEGIPEAVLREPAVIQSYLGEAAVSGVAALAVADVVAGIGGLQILHGVTLEVADGAVTVLLGANGAGKTTLLRTVAGLLAPRAGTVLLFGEEIGGRAAHLVARAGIGHVPSGRELFPKMSVADHLALGSRLCAAARQAMLRERVLDLFPNVAARLRQAAGTLSGGEQQMVAIARALMTDPRVLLLDEPSAGLAPKIVQSVFDTLPKLQSEGVSVLLAEQSLTFGMAVASRAYIIREGRIVLSGTPAELAADQGVVKAYLGA